MARSPPPPSKRIRLDASANAPYDSDDEPESEDSSESEQEPSESEELSRPPPPDLPSDPHSIYTVLCDIYEPLSTPPNSGFIPVATFPILQKANAFATAYPINKDWWDGEGDVEEAFETYTEKYDAATGCVSIDMVFSDMGGSSGVKVVKTRFDEEAVGGSKEAWCVLGRKGLVALYQSRVGAEVKLERMAKGARGLVLVREGECRVVDERRPEEKLFWMERNMVGP